MIPLARRRDRKPRHVQLSTPRLPTRTTSSVMGAIEPTPHPQGRQPAPIGPGSAQSDAPGATTGAWDPAGADHARAHGSVQPFPPYPAHLPDVRIDERRYQVRFAHDPDELDTIQRLRYEVFNLELGEGLESSHITGRDADPFDATCHHLLVVDTRHDQIIGTYRLQTAAMAAAGRGYYSAGEFDLSRLPASVREHGIEIGRACIHRDHRKQRVLFALWKGLAAYLTFNRKHYLFGCCSLTSQDAHEAWRVYEHLRRQGHVHPDEPVRPLPGFECSLPKDERAAIAARAEKAKVPPLFATYLRYHAKVYGPPVIDREFKTIDYLVVTDCHDLDPGTWKLFFGTSHPTRS